MKILLFNWENVSVNDPTDLTDKEFEELALKDGFIYDSLEDFESAFNAEHFSTATHQLRIVEELRVPSEEKIKEIQSIVNKWGAVTSRELELDSSPCFAVTGTNKNVLGQLVENFNLNSVTVVSYHNAIEINEFEVPYEDLRDDLIDEIYQIIQDYDANKMIENE